MGGGTNHWRTARILRVYALLYAALLAAALVLVHASSYEPAVSYLPLHVVVALGLTAALVLLPAESLTDRFGAGAYGFFAFVAAPGVFFSGGASSELYVLFLSLLLAAAFHGSRMVGLLVLAFVLVGYSLSVTPDLLTEGWTAPVLFRLAALGLFGGLVLAARSVAGSFSETYATDEDGSLLLELVSGEIIAGRGIKDAELLLGRGRARVAGPILLGEGTVFGMVISVNEERSAENAAGRALAVAGSLGAGGPRAGAA
ncbi:MAG: hypothetical protein WA990_08220 [Rubrobacteraceae bacterium]